MCLVMISKSIVMNYVNKSSISNISMVFHNIDLLIYIASFICDKMLLPFVLTSKSCLEASIASHRHFQLISLSYYSRRVEMAKWVLNINLQGISKLINYAAHNGALDVIMYLRERKRIIYWDMDLCSAASENGHLHVLEWLRSQDPPCPWHTLTCSNAAQNGHLDVLRWLRSQDPPCPWNEKTCSNAAWNGHLEVSQWLRSQDSPFPWD